MPEIDPDGDIKFKKEGSFCWVRINPKDDSPMFITLFMELSNPKEYSSEVIKIASTELNFYKGVKVLCYKSFLRIQAEMYLNDAEPFKYAFYTMLGNIVSAKTDFIEECEKVTLPSGSGDIPYTVSSKIPFLVTSCEVANVDSDGNIITPYGNAIYSYKTKYLKPRITVMPVRTSGTYEVMVRLFENNSLSTGNTSPDGYTFSSTVTLSGSSEQTFSLSGWGTNNAGNWSAGSYRFEVWLNGYCLGSKSFVVK